MKKAVVGGVVLLFLAVGLYFTEPWAFFQDSTVDEALPSAPADPSETAPAEPKVLSTGDFVKQEHDTSGTASIIELADGSRIVRLADFATTSGPDLHVWLSTETAGGNWFKYADDRRIELGELKANNGNQNYVIPADADLAGIQSVVIWCKRFFVAFGSAPVTLS